MEDTGKIMLLMGIVLVLIGIFMIVFGWLTGRDMLPKIPGDIYIKRDGNTFYFPLGWSILISVALTFLINIIFMVLKR